MVVLQLQGLASICGALLLLLTACPCRLPQETSGTVHTHKQQLEATQNFCIVLHCTNSEQICLGGKDCHRTHLAYAGTLLVILSVILHKVIPNLATMLWGPGQVAVEVLQLQRPFTVPCGYRNTQHTVHMPCSLYIGVTHCTHNGTQVAPCRTAVQHTKKCCDGPNTCPLPTACKNAFDDVLPGEEEDLDLGKMVREGEVAWLHKADMPGSGHGQPAGESSRQQGWHAQRQAPHSPDQAPARKRKDPPAGRHTHPATRPALAHPGCSLSLSPLTSLASGVGIPTVLNPSLTAFLHCLAFKPMVLCYGIVYGGISVPAALVMSGLPLALFSSCGWFYMLEGITVCTVGLPSFTAVRACTVTQSVCLSGLGSCTKMAKPYVCLCHWG